MMVMGGGGGVSLLFCEVIIVHNHFSYSLSFYILKLTDDIHQVYIKKIMW